MIGYNTIKILDINIFGVHAFISTAVTTTIVSMIITTANNNKDNFTITITLQLKVI